MRRRSQPPLGLLKPRRPPAIRGRSHSRYSASGSPTYMPIRSVLSRPVAAGCRLPKTAATAPTGQPWRLSLPEWRANTVTRSARFTTSLLRSTITTTQATQRICESLWLPSLRFLTGWAATKPQPPSRVSRQLPSPWRYTANSHYHSPPAHCPRRRRLRIARTQGRDNEHRRDSHLRLRPNRPGPSGIERRLEIDEIRESRNSVWEPPTLSTDSGVVAAGLVRGLSAGVRGCPRVSAGDQRGLADEVLRHAWLLTVWAADGDGVWVARSRWGVSGRPPRRGQGTVSSAARMSLTSVRVV